MSDESTTLDDALAGETQQPEEQVQTEQPADDKPEETPKGSDDGNVTVPLAALHAERDKNRDLRREVEEIKQSISQPAPQPEVIPDPVDDPEGFRDWQQRQFQGLSQTFDKRLVNERANMSEGFAVRNHGQQAVEQVKEWVKSQPAAMQQEIVQQSDPYEYAIQQHKRQSLTEQLTADPDKLDRVLKLLEGKQVPEKTAPVSTVSQQSVGGRTVPQWSGPTSLDDIFGD